MADKSRPNTMALADQLGSLLLRFPWIEILTEAWKSGRKILRGMADEGMYEVLEYESTLEIRDNKGQYALFRKREKVRYLQNSIIAYQDQAWGDGEILLNYKCTPGTPVDRYRPGHKTYILISLHDVKNHGDVDEFKVEWGIRKGFKRNKELWETEVSHRTKHMKIKVIFPKNRPALRASLIESLHRRTKPLEQDSLSQQPDGRWILSWETNKPKLNERYILQWEW
jgi:hypothetical protein